MFTRLVCVACLTAAFGLLGAAEPPKSASARKAADDYQSTLVKLDEDYRKALEPLKAEYIKALTESRKLALDKNDLEESQRIADASKSVDDLTAPVEVTAMRQRLSGTTWSWNNKDDAKLTFNANGTVTMTFEKGQKGFWHVNPDLTVVYWHSNNPNAWVMKFNDNLTSYEASVPKANLNKQEWCGKRQN